MAEAGGGEYYTADNAGEFMAAAREGVTAPTYTGGYLKIMTFKEDHPFAARAYVYNQGDNKKIKDKKTWYREKPAIFNLVPDIYCIKVYDRKTKEEKEIRDLEIPSGQTIEKIVKF